MRWLQYGREQVILSWQDGLLTGSLEPSSDKDRIGSGWRIVLPGPLLDRALDAVHAIAKDLLREALLGSEGIEKTWQHSLGYGKAGLALFFQYMHLATGEATSAAKRDALLMASTRAIAEQRMPSDLYRGFSGITWVWNHVHSDATPDKRSAAWEEINQALTAWVQRESTPAELFEGLGGVCLYLAECPSTSAQGLLELIVSRLEQKAIPQAVGVAFPMSARMRQQWITTFGHEPTDVWKISVAHGNAGCLAALASALTVTSDFDRGAQLIRAGCECIWSQELDGPRAFPEMVGADLPCLTSGWCNGDLGIALALFQMARRLDRTDWQERSLAIARRQALSRVDAVELNNRDNYCLCHGHAGRAHIFNRLYQTTDEAVFADAAIYWFEQCLNSRSESQGIGGFLLYEGFERAGKTTRGFLMGAAGLGLAMLAASTEVTPDWDRLLLASMPEG